MEEQKGVVAHGGDVVCIVMDKTRRAALCILRRSFSDDASEKQGELGSLKVITR